MFSFITRRFKKKPKEKELTPDEEIEAKRRAANAPTPYSMNFEGADEIQIAAVDCGRKNVEAVIHRVVRKDELTDIIERLADLPKEGERQMETDPCKEHTLTALTEGKKFALVTFYDGNLKLENGAFIANGERDLEKQAELYKLIKIM